MIMIPILILQIFLFPVAASLLMNIWVDSRRTLALQDATSHLGSAIQQLYLTLNHATIPAETIIRGAPRLPPLIDNSYYQGNATLRTLSETALNSSKILELGLILVAVGTTTTTSIILGSNVLWQESTFISNSASAYVTAEKFPNGTICLRFGE